MRANLPSAWLVWGLVLGFSTLPARGEIQGQIDPTQTELVAVLRKAGPAAFLAHDHVVEARHVTGQVAWEAEDLSASRVVVTVEAATLVPDDPDLRERYGLEGQPSAGDRKKIRQALQAPEQLFVRRYPQIQFRATHILASNEGSYEVTGEFTLRGVTRSIAVPLSVRVEPERWVADGRFTIRQSDFGYQPYSAASGAIRNADPVTIHVHLVAIRSNYAG